MIGTSLLSPIRPLSRLLFEIYSCRSVSFSELLQNLPPWRRSAPTSTSTVWRSSWRRCSKCCSMREPSGAASRKNSPVRLLVPPSFPLSAAAALCVCDVFKDGSRTKGTDNSLKAEYTVHSPTESDSFLACLAKYRPHLDLDSRHPQREKKKWERV